MNLNNGNIVIKRSIFNYYPQPYDKSVVVNSLCELKGFGVEAVSNADSILKCVSKQMNKDLEVLDIENY